MAHESRSAVMRDSAADQGVSVHDDRVEKRERRSGLDLEDACQTAARKGNSPLGRRNDINILSDRELALGRDRSTREVVREDDRRARRG